MRQSVYSIQIDLSQPEILNFALAYYSLLELIIQWTILKLLSSLVIRFYVTVCRHSLWVGNADLSRLTG